MAINPMQRRARTSFFQGALLALVIMLVVVLLLVKELKSINDAKEALEQANSEVYVAASDLKSGVAINMDEDFVLETVRTNVDSSMVISSDDWEFTDENGDIVPKYAEDGTQIYKTLKMKIDVPAGTIVTKEMIYEEGHETVNSERIQEYNMIILPSTLKNGDHIDIRLTMPTGQDYIVLSKKEVIGTTDTGLWLNVTEEEILTMNNAIVESYILPGTKLYAIPYTEAGMQAAAVPTYQVGLDVLALIEKDPNITDKARTELWARYNSEARVNYFDIPLSTYVQQQQDRDNAVQGGFQEEVQKVQEDRAAFVESLEGTEEIGYTR